MHNAVIFALLCYACISSGKYLCLAIRKGLNSFPKRFRLHTFVPSVERITGFCLLNRRHPPTSNINRDAHGRIDKLSLVAIVMFVSVGYLLRGTDNLTSDNAALMNLQRYQQKRGLLQCLSLKNPLSDLPCLLHSEVEQLL